MARIVLGVGTSHTPMLTLPSAQWKHRAEVDYANTSLNMTDGRELTYDQLLAEVGPIYDKQVTSEVLERKAGVCQAALGRLAEAMARAAPDVVVIIGDDQSELFSENNQPAIAVFHGDDIITYQGKYADPHAPDWMRTVGKGFMLDTSYTLQGCSKVALDVIRGLIDREVDVASVARIEKATDGGVGHAYGFVIKHLFNGRSIPVVPIMLNTYYPPNVPTSARCYDVGVKLRETLEAIPGDARVAMVASGGLSHFVVDEALDRRVMKALCDHDAPTLRSIPRDALKSGSSEILNWVMLAGAVAPLPLTWSEYQPVYRTPAGTGVGAAFCIWEPA